MQIHIEVMYVVNDCGGMRGATFQVNEKKFRENPDEEGARIALKWLWNIKKEHGYDIDVKKVLCNENDITDKVKGRSFIPVL
jgi:hypothetical protein